MLLLLRMEDSRDGLLMDGARSLYLIFVLDYVYIVIINYVIYCVYGRKTFMREYFNFISEELIFYYI